MQRQILIIDDHNDLAGALEEVFTHQGHHVKTVETRREAVKIDDIQHFDLTITDLEVENDPTKLNLNGNSNVCLPSEILAQPGEHIKAFKICASNFRRDEFDEEELKSIVATVLDYKIRHVDSVDSVHGFRESIEFELPSAMSLMHVVLEYLMKRVEMLGVIKAEQSNLYVALDEAFVNAVKHGNKFDVKKMIRIAADVSRGEARFTIEDEGEGFDVKNIPDPLNPENLFKTSGRGVLFIYNIMDEVKYNARGNRLTMIKKAADHSEQRS
ncbi:MAG: ATP-binding protein [Acidobacteriota bacterium]